MNKHFIFLTLLALFFNTRTEAQFSRYIVRLKNKGNAGFTLSNPQAYLSARALGRRARYSINIDSADLPVTPAYISQIRNVPNVTLLNVSKWMNAVSIQTNDANAINTIRNFPFVMSVDGIAARPETAAGKGVADKFEQEEEWAFPALSLRTEQTSADFYNYGSASYNEIHLHNGEFLHNIGLRGQNMHIAMLDAGFMNYTGLRAFDSVNINGQILSTWDFVSNHASVVEDHPHGMNCLSTIAANIPGQFIGKAPKASFHLFRTEEAATEYPIEEFNWVCGAERADSLGSDIISSSLGYYDFDHPVFNYTYNDMNGNNTISAIGADIAAKKGILVFNSVGNAGNSPWRYLVTPSDGDSVVAVGAVNAAGVIGSFSSYGPSSDGQIKPDVASVGVSALVQTTANTIGMANGTSFSCPNMAGLATCLWQGFAEFNNIRIIRALQKAGHRFSNPDDRVGYGIPDMKSAFADLVAAFSTSTINSTGCTITLNWTSKDVGSMKYEVERKGPGEGTYTKIADLPAQTGNLLAIRSYQFNNQLSNVGPGTYSYRIKQVIDTTIAGYRSVYIDSNTINIISGCPGVISPEKTLVTVQPNPSSGNTTNLVVETSSEILRMTILIYNNTGQKVQEIIDNKAAGRKVIPINSGGFAKGLYYIQVWTDGKLIGSEQFLHL